MVAVRGGTARRILHCAPPAGSKILAAFERANHALTMKQTLLLIAALLSAARLPAADNESSKPVEALARGNAMLAEYFRNETAALSEHCLADIHAREDWEARRGEYRRELQEMLGLWPMPARTDLKPVVTGRITNNEFTVEKIYFQASPGLYCTASLFLPNNMKQPAPTILYECGHWRLLTNGVSYGNKALYQIDGAWFARNGYVCLVLDTLLAGEIQGIHTGTRDRGLWWWNSRGYTPAGVEAWFGIRALDYLCTRPEVDTNRFGITGHSGGGAYSWTVTALDDRIKAAAPLAGMADAQSHIGDGVIDSHCDCNFFINIYRWDFPQLAALAAPRPLLIGGTDRDPLFHLDSTMRIYEKVRRIYKLYDATNKLGLGLAPGPHDEVPELQLAVLRWFNRFLKGEEKPVEMAAKKFLTPEQVRVFTTLPTDAINPNIAESFVPLAKPGKKSADEFRAALREKAFAGWPGEETPLEPKLAFEIRQDNLRLRGWDFASQHDVLLRLYLLDDASAKPAEIVSLTVLDQSSARDWLASVRSLSGGHAQFSQSLAGEFSGTNLPVADAGALEKLIHEVVDKHTALAFFAPRGVGLAAFSGDEKALTKIRRRFMLLGQTLDGMRVWDIRRAIQAMHYVREEDKAKVALRANGTMGVNALYAALFEPNVRRLELMNLPQSHAVGPDYLGILKICDIPQVLDAERTQAELVEQ
jgi:dienelactone hydrolase